MHRCKGPFVPTFSAIKWVGLSLLLACSGSDDNGVTGPPTPVVTTITVAPLSPQLAVGETVTLSVVVRDQSGAVMTGQAVTWTSASNSVATVNAAGVVTAVGAGSSEISASASEKSGSTPVTVRVPVASLALSVDTVPLTIGATLQLSATLRDAGGAVIGSRPIAWSSTSVNATVSNAGLVTAVQVGLGRIVATSEGKSDTATILVPPGPVSAIKETGNAKSATIDAAGGTLQATDADGVQYTLTVPPLALMSPVTITMTPLANVTGLPLSGGFVAGVDLQPSGLVFADAARLTIAMNPQPGAGQRLLGFSATSAGQELLLTPAGTSANTLRIPVKHFSLIGAGFGTTQDVDALYFASLSNPQLTGGAAVNALVILSGTVPRDVQTEQEVYHRWFDTWIIPRLQSVNSDAALIEAISDYRDWNEVTPDLLQLFSVLPGGQNSAALTSRRAQWEQTFVAKAKEAIAGNTQTCNSAATNANRITALNNALFWYEIVRTGFGLANAQNNLDVPTFLSGLCARVITQSITLVDPLEELVATTLTAQFALSFNNGQAIVPDNFRVTTTATGVTHQLPDRTALSPAGSFTGSVSGERDAGTAIIDLDVCYAGNTNVALAVGGTVLCRTEHLVRNVGRVEITTPNLPAGTVGSAYSATLTATGGNAAYQWSIASGALPSGLSLNASSGAISGTPQSVATSNFRIRVASGPLSNEKNFTISVAAAPPPPPPPPPPGGDCDDYSLTSNAEIAEAAGISCMRNLRITAFNNRITGTVNLGSLNRVTEALLVEGQVTGINLGALSQVSGPTNGASFRNLSLSSLHLPAASTSGDIFISDSPNLSSVRIGGSIAISGGGLTLQALPALTQFEIGGGSTAGSLVITSTGLSSLTGLTCGFRVGGSLVISNNPNLSTAAAHSKANCLIVTGSIVIFNNKEP